MKNLNKITLGAANCALDLGDGSERGEYVCQDYILNVLGRPHRCVNLMYTYYPKDKEWSDERISVTCKDMEISYQWDYPYDDYYPYGAKGQPFAQMQDVRRHGQDVMLTLTIDCSLEDSYLRKIAKDLRPYGRLKLRINHECAGTWFTHNKRFSYEEVGAFFVRFAKILKEEAPNVQTVFCSGFMDTEELMEKYKDAFVEAFKIADTWSVDAYLALNFGWPYSIAEKGGKGFYGVNVDVNFGRYKKSWQNLLELCGEDPGQEGKIHYMTTAELNTDGDVTGAAMQGESVLRFYNKIKEEKADWFKSVSFYQFRDRGRLGLEFEDPNNSTVGIKQPIMEQYKKVLSDDYFTPKTEVGEEVNLPYKMRWGGAEDAEGLGIKIAFEKNPVFCEATFEDDLSLMLEINGRWFYKSPKVHCIDFMPAFFDKPLEGKTELYLKIFSTPPEGINPDNGEKDWDVNYYSTLTEMPEMRIRYEAVETVG